MAIRDRIKELRRVKANTLVPNEENWRVHPDDQRKAIAGVLEEIGYADALLVRELEDGRLKIVDGHLRAETTPNETVPVLVLDVDEDEARLILATLDPLASMAQADDQKLGELLAGIQTESEAVQAMLAGLAEDHGIDLFETKEPAEDAGAEIDRAAELQEKWQVKKGDLWLISGKENHRLVCGDATVQADVDLVMDGDKAGLVFTDPPYGVSYQDDMDLRETIIRNRRKDGAIIENDNKSPEELVNFLASAFAVFPMLPGCSFYICAPPGDRYLPFLLALDQCGLQVRQGLCWKKQQMVFGRQDYHYQHEMIIYGWAKGTHYFVDDRTQTSVWEVDRPHASKEHPTMKPVELPQKAIKNSSKPGSIVYDPFCGSGTTLVACDQLQRRGMGLEIAPKYCAVILERMEKLGCECTLSTHNQDN